MGNKGSELRTRKYVLLLLFAVLAANTASANPSFTIGSNPYLTVFAYPHDLLRWPERGLVFNLAPQTLPWQGDVTNIFNRPSVSYTSNYQSVEFAAPYDYDGNPDNVRSWMEVSSYAYRTRYGLGGLLTENFGKFLFELGKTALNMELSAEGVARTYEYYGSQKEYILVPFDGETTAERDNLDFKVTYAHYFLGNPLGLKMHYTSFSSGVPSGHIRFARDGETYVTPHLTWGWATTGCNHIFGYSHINADAFFQNTYTVYGGRQWDLQASFELKGNYKSGIRYRNRVDNGDTYKWKYDEGSEYDGDYYVDEQWMDRKTSKLLRGYSKVRFYTVRGMDLGLLFFLQIDSATQARVNKLVESDPTSSENAGGFALEANPFFNYHYGRGYLDFGLLLEVSRTGMRNTRTRWNSVSGADEKDVLWSTSPYMGWSPYWEDFSKGSTWFFATGFEAYSSTGIYRRLSLQTKLTVLRKYTYTTKVYGESVIPDGGSSYEFVESHERNDYRNETWMTGSIGIMYGRGPVQALVDLQMPLAYLIKQSTKLGDNEKVLFEHAENSMWQVQEPVALRLMLVYAL
jgi:hypothetical protein